MKRDMSNTRIVRNQNALEYPHGAEARRLPHKIKSLMLKIHLRSSPRK